MIKNELANLCYNGCSIVEIIERVIQSIDECHLVEGDLFNLSHFRKFGAVLFSLGFGTESDKGRLELKIDDAQEDWIASTDPFLLQEILNDHNISLKRI